MLRLSKHLHKLQTRQTANDIYCKTLTFRLLKSQPEPVEGGFEWADQLRQAQLDTVIGSNFCHLQPVTQCGKSLKHFFMSAYA
jgi:hypothetical protein